MHFSVLIFTVFLSAMAGVANAHAYLKYPPSRNYQAFTIPEDPNKFYCPHCGNGNFQAHPSICGDPFQNVAQDKSLKDWIFTKKFYGHTTLKKGSIIGIQVTMINNHGGRMQVAVCPKKASQCTQSCFDKNLLRRHHPDDKKFDNKKFWYVYPSVQSGDTITEYFKLPDDLECRDGCLMQWAYLGYQTCVQPCQSSKDDVPGECGTNLVYPQPNQCTDRKRIETFYNCADVIIR